MVLQFLIWMELAKLDFNDVLMWKLDLMNMYFAGTVQVKWKAVVHPCGAPQVDNSYHGIIL